MNTPDQLEDAVDEAGSVVAAQCRVIVLQQLRDGVPALACVVHQVVATHVHVELDPVHLLRQVQDVCKDTQTEAVFGMSRKWKANSGGLRHTHHSFPSTGSGGWCWRRWSCRSTGFATGTLKRT